MHHQSPNHQVPFCSSILTAFTSPLLYPQPPEPDHRAQKPCRHHAQRNNVHHFHKEQWTSTDPQRNPTFISKLTSPPSKAQLQSKPQHTLPPLQMSPLHTNPHPWSTLPNHLSFIPTLPAFRRALKHHLFLLAYLDSSAKSGKIKPAQCITLRDIAPITATHHPETPWRPSKGVPSERLRLVKRLISHRLHTGACVNLVLLPYLPTWKNLKTCLFA